MRSEVGDYFRALNGEIAEWLFAPRPRAHVKEGLISVQDRRAFNRTLNAYG